MTPISIAILLFSFFFSTILMTLPSTMKTIDIVIIVLLVVELKLASEIKTISVGIAINRTALTYKISFNLFIL